MRLKARVTARYHTFRRSNYVSEKGKSGGFEMHIRACLHFSSSDRAGLWYCHKSGAARDRSTASTDDAVCLGQQTATGCKVMVVTVPAWPVQKLWLLLELLLLWKGAGSFPGSCHRPQCMRTGSQHIRAPFSSVFLPSFCCDTCLPSTSSNGNFACAAHLICKGRWGYCWRNTRIRFLKKTSLI